MKGPVEIESEKPDVLVSGLGTVAENVHWILLPVTLPLTEFTFNCKTKTVLPMTKKTMSFLQCVVVTNIYIPCKC